MFGLAMLGGLLVLIAFGMTGAASTFALLFFVARGATREDHRLPQIVLAAQRFGRLYDPAKRDWYPIR